MKLPSTLLLSASLFCILSCSQDKKPTAETETATAENLAAPDPNPIKAEITNMEVDSLEATMEFSDPQPTAGAPTTVTTASGMNPPHGLPGHNCDIPVGAPLNSKGK